MAKCLRLICFLVCFSLSLKASEPGSSRDATGIAVDAQDCLDLYGRNLTELPEISNIQRCNQIKRINLSGNALTNESLKADWFPSSVEHIDLSNNKLTDFPADFISKLPKSVKTLRLNGNTIGGTGEDVDIPQTGLKVYLDKKNLSEGSLKDIKERLEPQPGVGPTFRQRCIARLTSPCGGLTKLFGGAVLLVGAECIRKACDINPQSPVSRVVKIVQNGLFVVGALHKLYNTCVQNKALGDNPELAVGVAGLCIGTTPGLLNDARMLAYGSAAPVSKIESAYSHTVYSGMRDLGTMYACGECISWLKSTWARSLQFSIKRSKNELIAN